MPALVEGPHAGEFLVSEAPGHRSRETVTVEEGQTLAAGAVVGRVLVDDAAAAAFAGNAANTGTIGAVTVGAGAKPGDYRVVMIEPASNAGKFLVEDPDGIIVGTGTVAVAFSGGGLGFTVADGATDFTAGEGFTITVAPGSGEVREWNPANADGSQIPAGVLWAAVDAADAALPGVIIARDAEVNGAELRWFTGANGGNRAAGIAGLARLGIIAR